VPVFIPRTMFLSRTAIGLICLAQHVIRRSGSHLKLRLLLLQKMITKRRDDLLKAGVGWACNVQCYPSILDTSCSMDSNIQTRVDENKEP
jgi:hypothetical protein